VAAVRKDDAYIELMQRRVDLHKLKKEKVAVQDKIAQATADIKVLSEKHRKAG
jgi:hypothetical protein